MGLSISTSSGIVTSGLTVFLDAGNPRSYSGNAGDTTWYDLSGNGYHFTISPSAWASTGSTPFMNFNGSCGIAKRIVNNTLTDVPNFTNATVMVFSSLKPNQTNTSVYSDQTNWRTLIRGASNDHQIMVQNNNTNIIGMFDNNTSAFISSGYNITRLTPKPTTGFNCWNFRLSQSSPFWSFGFNTDYTLATITNASATFNNGFCCIGGLHNSSTDPLNATQYWGNVAVFLYYNRRLSDAEILQNINAYNERFNINTSYDTTGPVAHWDAGDPASYPGTGTTWYDISGNDNDAASVNGPPWNSNGWFSFNGSNQYFLTKMTGFPRNNAPGTISVWARVGNVSGWHATFGYGPGGGDMRAAATLDSTPQFIAYGDGIGGGTVYINKWYNMVCVYDGTTAYIYTDGILTASTAKSWNTGGNGNDLRSTIGIIPRYNSLFNVWDMFHIGDIAIIQVWSRALNATEITNNYNATLPRFTNVSGGLVVSLDASLYASGTTWKDQSGYGYDVTLFNSPTWNGSYFTFNGSNQYGTMVRSVENDFSIEVWFRTSSLGGSVGIWANGFGLVDGEVSGVSNDFGISIGNGYIAFGVGNPDTTIYSATRYNDNLWHHVVATRQKSTGIISLYIDNVLIGQRTATNTNTLSAPANLAIGRLQSGVGYLSCDVANVKIYNKVIDSSEVNTNWSIFRSEFPEPAADITTGLLGYWDAGVTASYPGTGTTWTDLSGNGNTVTLSAGTRTYSSSNGGILFFSGATVTLASTISLTGDFTINWWENLSGTINGAQGIVGLSGAGNDINHTSSIVRYYTGSADRVINDVVTTADSWYNYTFTRVGTDYKIYTNGVITGVSSSAVSTFTITNLARGNGGAMTGYLPVMKIYNRGLSTVDIQEDFNNFRSRYGI
jgi:hypothetical protein